ncbi:MAG: DUF465 domain-containing protein [Alphaproteobacteria bacterium]|nr:DUF465 domain-containing protein [Alphaproteobacteria bacterium]
MAGMHSLDHLKAKHADLEHELETENRRPHPDDQLIADLKRQKLKVKDEIAEITRH